MNINNYLISKIKNIESHYKLAFYSTIIFGIITHIYFFIGSFANEDHLGFIIYSGSHIGLGRWMPSFLNYMLPTVFGVMAILLLSITAIVTISLLEIKTPLYIIIVSSLIVTFPTLAYSFGYLFMVENYTIALSCSAVAVWITRKYKYGYLIGAILLSISLGEYQSYIAYSMGLCTVELLIQLLKGKTSIYEWKNKLLKYLLFGGLGVTFYFIIVRLSLIINKTELLDYKGINNFGNIHLQQIPRLLIKSYKRFFEFFVDKSFFATSKYMMLAYILIWLISCILVFLIIKNKKIYKKISNIICIVILLLVLPLCLNIIDVVATDTYSSTLNIYAIVLVIIFPFSLLEIVERESIIRLPKNLIVLLSAGSIIICSYVSINYYIMSNIYYAKINHFYQSTVALNNRVLSRIEQTDGFTTDTPIAIIANNSSPIYGENTRQFSSVIKGDQGLRDRFIGYNESPDNDIKVTWKTTTLINNLLGVKLTSATNEQIINVLESDEYLDMGIWPDQNSVKKINGIITVNFATPIRISNNISETGIEFIAEMEDSNSSDYQYAWYIYKDGQKYFTKWYTDENKIFFKTSEIGDYYALLFVQSKTGEAILQKKSEVISFND